MTVNEAAPNRGKVACPHCGTQMNRHAEKLDYGADPSSPSYDAALGAGLSEFHTCPGCHYVLERPVTSS